MSVIETIAHAWILIPVALLFGVGLTLTLNSGTARVSAGTGTRQWVGNLTSTVGFLGLCLLGLLLVQSIVGYNFQARW